MKRFALASPDEVAKYRQAHPDTVLVAYVNTTAATKCHVDICCTSGNAEKVIESIPQDQMKALFSVLIITLTRRTFVKGHSYG